MIWCVHTHRKPIWIMRVSFISFVAFILRFLCCRSRYRCRVLITSHGPISTSKLYLYRKYIYFYLLFIIISNVECIFAWYVSLWLNYVSEFIYCWFLLNRSQDILKYILNIEWEWMIVSVTWTVSERGTERQGE